MTERLKFLVVAPTWIAGRLRAAGDVVELTAAEAKYQHVRPADAADAATAAPRKPRGLPRAASEPAL